LKPNCTVFLGCLGPKRYLLVRLVRPPVNRACLTHAPDRGERLSGMWGPSEKLTPRVARLRKEYFSFEERDFKNEVLPFTTGRDRDQVWTPHNWSVVPEMFPFFDAYADSLATMARPVTLPQGFFDWPLVERRAELFSLVIEAHLQVDILEGELIVGGQFNTALSLCLDAREGAEYERLEDKFIRAVRELDELGIGNCGAIPGHIIPNYSGLLSRGLKGLVDESEAFGEGNEEQAALRRALGRTARAAREFAGRYAFEAERLAAEQTDAKRRGELMEIARICRKVPWEPAGSLHEALQSLWFGHMLIMAAESYPGPGLSHGRIDQYLYPFYKKDIDSGRLSREQAKELFHCFWIKHNYAYDYQGRVGNNQGINSSFGQLITLGGIDEHGKDASNDLTWLLLEVIEEMNLLEPKPNIRLHANVPRDLLERVASMVGHTQGSPFLINFDENAMQGLRFQGLDEERLWDYAPVGCLENTLQGDDRSGTVDVNLNLAKAVELALFDGRDLMSSRRVGPRTGSLEAHADFESFYDAYKAQLSHLLKHIISVNNQADSIRARFQPTPFLSLLVDGCAEHGRDITSGGARHNFITVEGIGLATAVDSLAAVKRLVYEQRRIDKKRLCEAIRNNFEGFEKERLTLINKAPKYGNDDEAVDCLAGEVSDFWTRQAAKEHSPATGRRYRGGYLSWNYWVAYAPKTAATPDGRRRGTYLSNGTCPVTGRDALGPTANTRSVGRLGLETAPNGDSHTITLSPALVRDDEHIAKLAAFLRAYATEGGTALQINILDPDTLRRAQADPTDYGNLLVRVTGYNAYFVTLGREIQDEIISRVAHERCTLGP